MFWLKFLTSLREIGKNKKSDINNKNEQTRLGFVIDSMYSYVCTYLLRSGSYINFTKVKARRLLEVHCFWVGLTVFLGHQCLLSVDLLKEVIYKVMCFIMMFSHIYASIFCSNFCPLLKD